jgi:hypothetical protein
VTDVRGQMADAPKVTQQQLTVAMRALAAQSHTVARARGFHAGNKSPAEAVAFVIRNLGLALGYLKRGDRLTEIKAGAYGKPMGFPIKLADAVIGISDIAASCGIDIGEAVARKTAWNAGRVRRG